MKKNIKPIIAVIILAVLAILSVTMIAYGVINLIDDRAENADVAETTESTQETLEEKKETESEEDIAEMMTKETEVTTEATTEVTTEATTEVTTEPTTEATTEPVTTPPETTSTTESTIDPEPNIGMTDLDMLACVIYQEAGSDSSCDDCRRRVADVVLNRVADERFPDTIYEVLTQRSQYGRFHWTGVVWPSRATSPYEQHAVERAYRIAAEVLNGQHSDLYGLGYIWQAEFKQGTGIIYHCGTYFGRS